MNGGQGTVESAQIKKPSGTEIELPMPSNLRKTPTSPLYFNGWGEGGTGGTPLMPGSSYVLNGDVTFVAIWGEPVTATKVSFAEGTVFNVPLDDRPTLTLVWEPVIASNQAGTWTKGADTGGAFLAVNGTTGKITPAQLGTAADGTSTVTFTSALDETIKATCKIIVVPTPVTLLKAEANGSATVHTTQLTLTFSRPITGIDASIVDLTSWEGGGSMALTGDGSWAQIGSTPVYTVDIEDFAKGGSWTVGLDSDAVEALSDYVITGTPAATTVSYVATLTAKADRPSGEAGSASNGIKLTFNRTAGVTTSGGVAFVVKDPDGETVTLTGVNASGEGNNIYTLSYTSLSGDTGTTLNYTVDVTPPAGINVISAIEGSTTFPITVGVKDSTGL